MKFSTIAALFGFVAAQALEAEVTTQPETTEEVTTETGAPAMPPPARELGHGGHGGWGGGWGRGYGGWGGGWGRGYGGYYGGWGYPSYGYGYGYPYAYGYYPYYGYGYW